VWKKKNVFKIDFGKNVLIKTMFIDLENENKLLLLFSLIYK